MPDDLSKPQTSSDELRFEPQAVRPLEEEDLKADERADAAVAHTLGESLPVIDLPLAEPLRPGGVSNIEAAEIVEPSVQQTSGAPTLVLERKHPLAIRWMHWINFPVLFTMIWSGLLIYWGDSDNAYQHPHRVYRIGLGSWTLVRMFPEFVYRWLNAPYQITKGLGWHFFFMWIFAINGLIYVLYLAISGQWRLMVPTVKSWREAIQVTLYDLHLSKTHPPVKKYNGAQKIAYTAIVLMGAGSLVTGLAIYKPTQAHLVTTLLGGYEMARWEHFWLTMGFCAFFLLHVGQVVKTGWNNFRGMVSGYEVRPMDATPYTEERRAE